LPSFPVTLHPIVQQAAGGVLPPWAVAGDARRAHMLRVAELLGSWARALSLDPSEETRWRAAGFLHDAVRDEDPGELRLRVPPGLRSLHGPLLHGPAAAERLRIDGVDDGELLRAVAYHTLGHEGFGRLGRALFAADFLEPGRTHRLEWRAERRARMPHQLDEVVFEVLQARMEHGISRGNPLNPETMAFWNRLVEERR
jgi:2-amino-4-hydroxy-6-hydroxymethyldihydropteridine diphosphokinase